MIIAVSRHGSAIVRPAASMAIRARYSPSHAFIAPLAVPAEQDLIDLVGIADPATPWPTRIKHATRPTVILIGDDPGAPDGMGGPDAWRCTRSLGRWARGVLVHGTGGQAAHYAGAVRAARQLGRVALIETTSVHAQAWAERLNCRRTLLLLPRSGSHPLGAAEAMQ